MALPEAYLVGPGQIPVKVQTSSRARRMTLRIAAGTGEAKLTVPRWTSRRQIDRFLRDHTGWLSERHAAQPGPLHPEAGDNIPLLGMELRLHRGAGRKTQRDGDTLLVPGEGDVFRTRLLAWMKAHARDALARQSDIHAATLGKRFCRLTLRDPRTRWGSCSSEGALMYSWRLVMAPFEVMNYVAAHEVAHLAEMNHSPAFWSLVEQLDPDFDRHRNWLRDNGAALHRYRF